MYLKEIPECIKIAVLGASGNISQYCIESLCRRISQTQRVSYEICILTRNPTSPCMEALVKHKEFSVFEGNITDIDNINLMLSRVLN